MSPLLAPRARLALAAACLGSLIGCRGSDFPLGDARDRSGPTRPQVWTLDDLVRARAAGERIAAADPSFTGFDAAELIDEPSAGTFVPKVQPAFSEGAPAAYVVSDVWVGYEAVWAQPWYYLLTAWNDRSPQQNRLKAADGMAAAPPLFDVGPDSSFYSPFWQIRYVVVPPGTAADQYASTRQLFDDRLPIHDAGLWTYAIRPASWTLGAPTKLVHPFLGTEIGNASLGDAAVIDGQRMPYVSLGGTNFHVDDQLVVEEVPLFLPARWTAAGTLERTGDPAIVGSSPVGTRTPADVVDGRPRFGAYTRVYLAIVPATAAAFNPDVDAAGAAALVAKAIDPAGYRGRIAVNARPANATTPGCFDAPTFPDACQWIDSGARVEDRLGTANLVRTSVTLASPLVFFAGKGIGR